MDKYNSDMVVKMWGGIKYLKNTRGNVTVMIAICIIPLLICVGVALDYAMISKQETQYQDHLDVALLAAIQEENKSSARKTVLESLEDIESDYELSDFKYKDEADNKTISARLSGKHVMSFGGILGKKEADISVISEVQSIKKVSEVRFSPSHAKGQYNKNIYLKVRDDSGAERTVGTFNYTSGQPNPFTVSSSNWIELGSYDDIWLEMHVHYDVEEGATTRLKEWYGDDQTFSIYEAGFSQHLWVNDVQLRPDQEITPELLFPCGLTTRHAWEDVPRGYPTTDTPDFYFRVESKCESSVGGIRISR